MDSKSKFFRLNSERKLVENTKLVLNNRGPCEEKLVRYTVSSYPITTKCGCKITPVQFYNIQTLDKGWFEQTEENLYYFTWWCDNCAQSNPRCEEYISVIRGPQVGTKYVCGSEFSMGLLEEIDEKGYVNKSPNNPFSLVWKCSEECIKQ